MSFLIYLLNYNSGSGLGSEDYRTL